MTEADILKERNNIITLAREAKLYEAFSSFGALLNSTPNWDISEELSRLQTSYKYMLTYMAQGMADPQKEQIYTELLASLYDLIDRYCHKTLPRYSHSLYYAIAHDFAASGASLESIFGSYSEELEKYRLYADIPTDEKDGNKVVELARNVEKGAIRLFNFVWTSFRPSQGELETLKRIMTSADTPSPLKQLLLSALLLNLNHSYDENLLSLLFDVYAQFGNTDDDIAIRAACCIFFTLHKYHYVASLSGNITSRLDELNGDKDFKDAINIITLQFIKSCDTDKLTKMVHDELLPGIMNAGAGFFKNIKRNKINPNDLAEMESNPEWEDFLEKRDFAPNTAAARADMLAFEEKMYERYFKICREAVKAVSPDAMYIGCRFAWRNPLVERVASRYCDALSYNVYADNVTDFSATKGAEDKPIIIGEFHFGNTDKGVYGGGLNARATAEERAQAFREYAVSAFENPKVVGAHWFQWFDLCTTGRFNEANYAIGFVDICDTPDYVIAKAARKLSKRMYDIRLRGGKSTRQSAEAARSVIDD